jgi:hypothetical protein
MRCAALATRAMPPGASQAPHWTEKSHPSPPLAGRGPGSVSPPTSPPHLADADGVWRLLGASRLQPPRDLYGHRAHRSSARMLHAATDSRARRGARDAGLGVPGRSPPGALFPGHAAPCSTVPPTDTAHPTLPAAAESNTDAPSRRHRPSSSGAARHRFCSTTPRPTGDACARLGRLWEHRLCPGGLYPSSILWAEKAAGPPGCGPCWRRLPSTWPLDRCRLCPDDHTTA